MGQQGAEPPEDAPQHPDLQQHQQQHQPEAAEDRVDDPLLALFQEPEAAVLELPEIAPDSRMSRIVCC